MARIKDRQKALELRKQQMSYSQIKKILGISKSTLSGWLRDYPLSRERINELRARSEVRIERYRETMRKKRATRLDKIYSQEKNDLLPLSQKELYLAGLLLYWGEGSKTEFGKVFLSNTDPQVIKFTLYWLISGLGIDKSKIKVYLQLYSDMNIEAEINYWSNSLNIDKKQFNKPYIKKSKRVNINHKGFGHGTCGICANNTVLKEKILMGIKSIADYYGKKVQ